jgi:hypothetical protein
MDSVLRDEVLNDPAGLGYAALLPDSPGQVVEIINDKRFTLHRSRMISERGLMARMPSGAIAADAVLTKLENYSKTSGTYSTVVARALKFLALPDGIDIGEPATQGLIDILAASGVITSGEAAEIKDLSLQPASRAEILGLSYVTEQNLRDAGVV